MDQHVDPEMTMHTAVQVASFARRGIAFSISDLLLIRAWAECHDVRLAVCLDHQMAPGDDFEEIVAFESEMAALDRLMMWRDAKAVYTVPLAGIKRRFETVSEALAYLLPEQDVILTDIDATAWPAG